MRVCGKARPGYRFAHPGFLLLAEARNWCTVPVDSAPFPDLACQGVALMVAKGNVPHDDYRSGFEAGFQAIAGTARAVPTLPAQPATRAGFTPFLMGIREGLERAGLSLD